MDDLLNHCIRELGFDGDLGCSPSRLGEFVKNFYIQHSSTHHQLLDDDFISFMWSQIVEHPNVRVGTIPPGLTSEVYVAPQTSAARKARAKGIELEEIAAPELCLIEGAQTKSLPELQQEYGNDLRIALTPDAVFEAITGSHIRPSKLSPMVYSALRIITRGRENGVTVIELGQQTKYDQKTCFYLVKQLVELNLIVKVRRGGVGTHFCLHRYYFDRDPSWRDIREEETQAEARSAAQEDDAEDEDSAASEFAASGFAPIDARHLSSLPLIRGRVVKLLKMSPNNMHKSNNMLVALGFSNPSKTDRRFFQTRMRDLMAQGVVERVLVQSKRNSTVSMVKCYRLVTDEARNNGTESENIIVQPIAGDDDEEPRGVKCNITMHKQLHDLLEESGTTGRTINELVDSLYGFDRRTVELFLARGDNNPPPTHLRDLGIISLMETYGRERRHRFMTLASYHELLSKDTTLEGGSSNYGKDVDLNVVGGFAEFDTKLFAKGKFTPAKGRKAIRNRVATEEEADEETNPDAAPENSTSPTSIKRKRKSTADNENQEDGGSPSKKRCIAEEKPTPTPKKRGRPPKKKPEEVEQPTPTLKKRGRPRKIKPPEVEAPTPTPKRRGRPPKNKPPEDTPVETVTPRKRGRPRKYPIPASAEPDKNESTNNVPEVVSDMDSMAGKRAVESVEAASEDEQASTKRAKMCSEAGSPDIEPPCVDMDVDEPREADPNPDEASLPHIPDGDPTARDTTIPSPRGIPGEEEDVDRSALLAIPLEQSPRDPTPLVIAPAAPPKAKKTSGPKVSTPVRVDISRMRRENEIQRVLEDMGGVFNVNWKAFYDAHAALVETMNKAGEPTSILPGMKLDKRTAFNAISNMEDAGRVKVVRTSVGTSNGGTKFACVAYLPTTEETKVQEFLASLERNALGIHTDTGDAAGIPTPMSLRNVRIGLLDKHASQDEAGVVETEKWVKNSEWAEKLFQNDDDTVRQLLLTEKSTLGQLYGFVTSKVLRCRLLHKVVTEAFNHETPSSFIASKDRRIIDTSFFFNDIDVATYCSLWGSMAYAEQLSTLLSTEEGRGTLVKDVSSPVSVALQIGRARCQSRLLDMLLNLHYLGIVAPLQPTETEAEFSCTDHNHHPSSYKTASLKNWTIDTPTLAPQYWQFQTTAPLFLVVIAGSSPPFWKTVPVSTPSEVSQYWKELQIAALESSYPHFIPPVDGTPVCQVPSGFLKALRRTSSWSAEYSMTWHQKYYLQRFIATKEQYEDSDLEQLAWVSSIPKSDVIEFVIKGQATATAPQKKRKHNKRLQLDTAKLERFEVEGEGNQLDQEKMRLEQEAKALLVQRAIATREQREREWDELLACVHSEPLSGAAAKFVGRVKGRFLDLVVIKDNAEWQKDIRAALQDAESAKKSVLKRPLKRKPIVGPNTAPPPAAPPIPVTVGAREKSVRSLVEQQEKLMEAMPHPPGLNKKNRRKDRKCEEQETQPSEPKLRGRRARFQWNWDFEELARDASVVIRSRCRTLPRLDFTALDQVFPSLARNTVRQRLVHIRQAPGNEAYLSRLEERWHEIWMQYRGTEYLPDDDVSSAYNFDLPLHVEFLRKHIDKNAIRVGLLERQKDADVILPSTVADLMTTYTVQEYSTTAGKWDFMWNLTKEEGREQALLLHPFTLRLDDHFMNTQDASTGIAGVAESALKMVMGTDRDVYEPEDASALLKDLGDDVVSAAALSLLSKGVLSKLTKESRRQPGRTLGISEQNSNALGGFVSREVFQDASALEASSAQQQGVWREWSLLSAEGDVVALSHLTSEGKIDFQIDTTYPQSRRAVIDWNSKKADDDDIETSIQVMFHDLTLEEESNPMEISQASPRSDDTDSNTSMGHGTTADGKSGSCSQVSDGVFDCDACLHRATSIFLSLDENRQEIASRILAIIQSKGSTGITKQELLETTLLPYEQVNHIIHLLSTLDVPLLCICGYDPLVIVSTTFVSHWSIVVCRQPLTRVFPRRWLDIYGNIMNDVWEAAQRAVLGVIVFKPGIAQSELRWRLRSVYDRHEINDVLICMTEKKILRRVTTLPTIHPSLIPDNAEESQIMWFLNEEKKWYNL